MVRVRGIANPHPNPSPDPEQVRRAASANLGHISPISRPYLAHTSPTSPQVRRAASANLAKLASAMFEAGEQPALKSELLPLFSALSTDEQVRVRGRGRGRRRGRGRENPPPPTSCRLPA